MSAGTQSISGYTSPNPYLQGILWGDRWYSPATPSQTVIVYAPSTTYAPNAAEVAAYTQIFNDISSIANITFVLGSTANADILLNAGTGAQMAAEMGISATALGVANTPGGRTVAGDEQSWVFNNRDLYNANGLNKGGYDYITWLHEIGHALGLAHPHDNGGNSTVYPGVTGPFNSLGVDSLNQGIFTTMSYNDGWVNQPRTSQQFGWQATMMAFDVAALQLLYGANMTTRTGNDTYVLSDASGIGSFSQCIWDAGGASDMIYYGGANNAVIDLRAATLGTGYGAGGYISYFTNITTQNLLTIAAGVTIENAVGGSGNDTIVGNGANNYIYSLAGADVLYGLGGDDFFSTDAGIDVVYAGAGNDSILAGNDGDTLYGEGDSDYANGGLGNDVIYGGAGYDNVLGGGGFDYLIGGSENDYFNLATDVVSGEYDILYDLVPGSDYVLIPSAAVVAFAYANVGPNAYCYALLPNSTYYVFIALGITAAQLQSQTIAY